MRSFVMLHICQNILYLRNLYTFGRRESENWRAGEKDFARVYLCMHMEFQVLPFCHIKIKTVFHFDRLLFIYCCLHVVVANGAVAACLLAHVSRWLMSPGRNDFISYNNKSY